MLIAPRLGLRLHDEAMHLCDSCSNAPQFSPDMTQPVWFSTVARISDEPLPGVAIMKMQRDAASCAVSKAWMIIKGRWDLLDVWRLARESSEGVSAVQLQDCREVSGACCRTAQGGFWCMLQDSREVIAGTLSAPIPCKRRIFFFFL